MSEEKNIEQVSVVSDPVSTESDGGAKPKRRPGRPRKAPAVSEQEGGEDIPKPTKRRGRPRKTAVEDAAASVESSEVLQARALAQISQASVVRRQKRKTARAEEVLSPDTDTAPRAQAVSESVSSVSAVQAELPLVDPALRPHRRGRKPKAYLEAEKAAAAALAAQQTALTATPEKDAFEEEVAPTEERRVPRVKRVKKPDVSEQADEVIDASSDMDERAPSHEGRATRRMHQRRQDEGGADKPATSVEVDIKPERSDKSEKPDRHERDKVERPDRLDRAAKNRERRERQQAKRKERNGRFAPVEPSLTREELEAMKVAELRDKARELDLDPAGKKKAELVEEVYAAAARAEGFRDIEGILDIDVQGFGYVRAHGYMPSRDDAFVPAQLIRAAGLRPGDYIEGTLRPMRPNDKLPGLSKLRAINGQDPDRAKRRPKFADLTPIYPDEPLRMEHGKDSITGRAVDIVSPIGKGQRGLIVSPPKAGKTTILKKICQSISINNPEVHLICLLVDERPEEVTDMERSIKGDVVASTFDMPADNHTRVSELVIERAKRIVELGGDVVVVLDSITRLARAYNLAAPASGRILSGGVDSAALYPPKRFLGAARNIENGGSLTILASALVDTGSKMDEVIFEESKGTGNMELKLDRELADRRIFPAIDPVASGTRNEDLLVDEQLRPFMWGIRRILAGMNNTERAAASFIKGLKGTNSNQEFLIRTAKKAADHPDAL